jgi:DNA-binding LacI/PurR family transcriptional regulator
MATLKDIAQHCQCNISTVSRALQGSPLVTAETIARVQEAAKFLGYKPNLIARNLVCQKTGMIWLVVPELDAFTSHLPAVHLSAECKRRGYDLLVAQYHSDPAELQRHLQRVDQGLADAVIFISHCHESLDQSLQTLARFSKPCLLFDRHPTTLPFPSVSTDNFQGAYELARALIKDGCCSVIDVFAPDVNTVEAERSAGLRAACAEAGIPVLAHGRERWKKAIKLPAGEIGLCISSASDLKYILSFQPKLVARASSLSLGVFDQAPASPSGFHHIHVCPQDWPGLARAALDSILSLVGDQSPQSHIRVAPLPLIAVQ